VHTLADGEIELGRFRLPVSGRLVALRQPSGAEDLLLAEAARTRGGDIAIAMGLAGRLVRAVEGEPLDWSSMSVTDLDALVLRLRQAVIGDRIVADIACPALGCGRRIDIDFGVEAYLAHHTPKAGRTQFRGWKLEPTEEPGWFCLAKVPKSPGASAAGPTDGADAERVRFRLPTAADLLGIAGRPVSEGELASRCLRPVDLPARLRRHAEAAMEAMAPSLSGDLLGVCPECGSTVTIEFDARWFCLQELRDRATFIYQDVDLLARHYHWSEAEILSMPHIRRAAYAELVRQAAGA
jgi:hypothetical protein